MIVMKSFIKITSILVLIIVVTSCTNKRNRQVQFMADTDMYEAIPYETYSADHSEDIFKDGMAAQLPVHGTIARGKIPYDYPNTETGYVSAKDSLMSPLKVKMDSIYSVPQADVDRGKYLYGIYCATCHGLKGDGQGDLVKNEKFLGVPNYKDREITEGSIYHVIMYGRNLMGSHASQLNEKERWQVTHYVQQLRNDLLK